MRFCTSLVGTILLVLVQVTEVISSQFLIGVNYGKIADNLPAAAETVKLIQSTSIRKIRLYEPDHVLLHALGNTGIDIVLGVLNSDIPALASDPNFAYDWLEANVLPFHPASSIRLITVGNEITTLNDETVVSSLLLAMKNLQMALQETSLAGTVKVSTVHSMSVLKRSDPPSSAVFDNHYVHFIKGIIQFNNATDSPFAINPYPYFAYANSPTPEMLAYCLFETNGGRLDKKTNINYMNMFDAQIDAVNFALRSMGFENVEIMVAETGWPHSGDAGEEGANVKNARAYNGNLINHLKSIRGTPLVPNKTVETYLFALYDEDKKPGPGSERAFGLYKPDKSMSYDVGLSGEENKGFDSGSNSEWCMPKDSASDEMLQKNIDFACGQVDCSRIQRGGDCFDPNTVKSHAAYAMNLFYQSYGMNPWNCDFDQTATLSSKNPSYAGCSYPGRPR